MSSFDPDRARQPRTSATPVRQPKAAAAQPLAKGVREKMETGFGHDFSAVRVHADSESASQTRAIGAQAYTVGSDVHFAAGRYQPQSEAGQQLLAHELAHVVQQAHGGAAGGAEQRADTAAVRIGRGETVSPAALGGAPVAVQAKPDAPDKPADAPLKTDPNKLSENIDKFGHNSATLTGQHSKSITALAAAIAARLAIVASGRATITITGHTDTSGDEKYNKDLGQKRADAARTTLEAALAKQKIGSGKIGTIDTASTGESDLANPTKDGVKEPLNRRVVIMVKIEAPPPVVVVPGPSPWPKEEKKKFPDLTLPPDYKPPEEYGPRRPPGEDWWKKAEENQRKIDEFDKKHPHKPKSLTDVIVEGVTEALEPIIKKLPKSLQDKAREGIRKGIEAGTEKACEAAIDASGVSGQEAEAMKAACKAALKTKPSGENK